MSSITQIKDTYWKWLAVVAVATALSTANAGERTFDFETDPIQEDPDYFEAIQSNLTDLAPDDFDPWSGASVWEGEGNPGEFLALTEAIGGQWTIVVFPDIDDGEQIKAFTLTADIRTGNSTSDRAADGFSISYARADDPLVQAAINDNDLNQGLFGHPRVAEVGASTGVAISFDTWDGNQTQEGSAEDEFEGIYVHVDGEYAGGVPLPTRHGECEDDTSLQTGPRTANNDTVVDKYPHLEGVATGGNPDVLCWAPLEVTLTETGLLTVKWKERTILDNFQTDFYPSPGRLVLGGRTGGANAIIHIDNIVLTTILADKPLLSGIEANTPNSFTVRLSDVSNSQVDQSSVALELDGEAVDAANLSISKDGEITSATYTQSTLFESGSTHEVRITADTTDGGSVEFTVPFTVPNYTLLGAEHKLDGPFSERGFKMRVLQSQPNRSNYTSDREQHLAGLLTDAEGNPLENFVDYGDEYTPDAAGYIAIEEVINFDQAENGDPVAQGVFRDGGTNADIPATDVADGFIPGIPGTREGDTDDQVTAEILTIVEIPEAGFYKFAFNSDDGFRTTTGQTSDILKAIELGVASQGRGATTTFYNVWFEEAGFYKLRSLWYEGGGGANLEWWTAEADGTPIALLNDDTNGGLNCYRDNIPEDPASVVWFDPIRRGETQATPNVLPMALGVLPNAPITAVIRNGTTSLDADSITLTLNGEAVTPAIDTSGDDTTVTYKPEGLWASGSTNAVVLNFTHDGGTMESRSWTFTVSTDRYSTLDCFTGTALGSGSDRGINYFVHHNQDVGGVGNIQQTEDRLVSDVENFADPDRGFVEVINFQQEANLTQGHFNDGNGFPDDPIPGLDTGDQNNIAAEFTAYLEFPEAGYYRMGVNSDDGFKVSNGEAGDRGPVNDARANALEGAEYNQGRGTRETAFGFEVPVAGVYPMRLIWWEGGGGADVEWYSIAPNGTRTLINAEGGIKAYQSRSATALECPLTVTSISPGRSATDVAPNAPIQAIIRNGITSLDADSVMLTLNGQSVTPEITMAGDETTVAYTPEMLLPSGSTNMVTLSFTHGGGTAASESWSFVVETYETIDCTMGVAMEAGATRGFNFVTHQNQNNGFGGNNVNNAERRLFDDSVENEADPPTGTIDGVVNFQQRANDTQGRFNAGNGFPDALIPGTPEPSDWDNIVQEITAYIEFPEAGYYRMGVNRDDGFKVSNALSGQGPVDDPATTDVNEALSDSLGHHDAGGGTNETAFGFEVPVAGFHPMRLIWFEGGGGADVEWYSIADDGTRTLINAEGGLKAYRSLVANPTPLACPGVGPVILASLNADGNVVLTFTGTLHSSDSVTGTFEPVEGATSPYTITVKAGTVPPIPGQPSTPAPQIPAAKFYIVR